MFYTPKQFKNQNANWQDKNYTYAIHKTSGGAMYLYQIDGKRITTKNIENAKTIRLDGVNLEQLIEQIRKVQAEN